MRSLTKISSRICRETGRAAATARSRVASPLTVVTMPALSSDWAAAMVGRPAHSSAADIAKIFVPDIITFAPFDRHACRCIAPVSTWESKASATRTLRRNRVKSLIGWCQQIDARPLTFARNGIRPYEIRMHFMLECNSCSHAGELLAREHRAGGEGAHLLIAHVAGGPAEAAVGIDVELLGAADREHPPDAGGHVLRALGIEALHVDDPGPQLAILAVLLPEVELRELPARELEHELLGPGRQHPREVRPVRAVEPRPAEAVAEADVEP